MVQLGDKGDKFPGELSGGMQQRVGIARAFSIEPDVMFMDEPFSHLDAITARSLRKELHEMWAETGKTVIFVTHDVGEAVELSNRILVFAKGGRLEDDITSTWNSPATPQTRQWRWPRPTFFASSKNLTWWPADGRTTTTDPPSTFTATWPHRRLPNSRIPTHGPNTSRTTTSWGRTPSTRTR